MKFFQPQYFFLLICLLVCLSLGTTSAAKEKCGRHGDPCVSNSECCPNIKCHRYANRCQVQITEDELMAAREKILGRRGKDY